jgi:ribonuclease BN (tRNA processing enzyme)
VAIAYGHATVQDSITLGLECDAGTVVLFHHSPARTDDALDEIAARAQALDEGPPVVVAREGMTIDVARRA